MVLDMSERPTNIVIARQYLLIRIADPQVPQPNEEQQETFVEMDIRLQQLIRPIVDSKAIWGWAECAVENEAGGLVVMVQVDDSHRGRMDMY